MNRMRMRRGERDCRGEQINSLDTGHTLTLLYASEEYHVPSPQLVVTLALDGSGRGRDGPVGSHHLDSTRSPSARSGAGPERSPDIREGAPPRERRVNLHQKTSTSTGRLSDNSIPVIVILFMYVQEG